MVMVQQLGVCLLVRQDVEEWGRCITSGSCSGIQRPWTPQCRRQGEGRRGPCVETLLIKRLQVESTEQITAKSKARELNEP